MRLTNIPHASARRGCNLAGVLLLCGALGWAQTSAMPTAGQPSTQPAAAQTLTPNQLDDLVAPIALYPDPLLGQVLAASTYPLELVEAQQWMQQNRNLSGAQLMDASRQQNWDPSVQALVAFPDALTMLNRDIRWTTDLGNAYLAQQNDVMAAIQSMRLRAQQSGRLASTPQQTVSTQAQGGQNAIVIDPANPQVIYVPTYNPEYIWGPPVWGVYPPLWYPAIGFSFGFGRGIVLGGFFPGWGGVGWGGWGAGWGWGCGWFGGGRGLYVNDFFFSHYGFHGYYHGGLYRAGFPAAGREGWEHDPYHRGGVRYGNSTVAARYNNSRFAEGRINGAARSGGFGANAARSYNGSGPRGFNGAAAARGFAPTNQPRAGNASPNGRYNSASVGHAGSSFAGNRNFTAQANHSPASSGAARSFATPRSAGGAHSSPRSPSSASRSFAGHAASGGHAAGGGHPAGGSHSAGVAHASGGGHTGGGDHGGGRR